ncbi:hypothetical protein BZA70DRAFT_279030 [Myxozyma melibiosi]|uniref:Shugoshin C-terminal domain-containing protein n=1 Tax=Myxozyma melibiosi TaxID=54550 RepID=A0ABR1F5I8_9ASCO
MQMQYSCDLDPSEQEESPEIIYPARQQSGHLTSSTPSDTQPFVGDCVLFSIINSHSSSGCERSSASVQRLSFETPNKSGNSTPTSSERLRQEISEAKSDLQKALNILLYPDQFPSDSGSDEKSTAVALTQESQEVAGETSAESSVFKVPLAVLSSMKNMATRTRAVLTTKSKSETADASRAYSNSLEFLFSDSASEMDDTEIQEIPAPRQSQIRDLNSSSARLPNNEPESSPEVDVTPPHPPPPPPRAHYTSSPMRANTAEDFVVFPPFAIPSSAADTVLIIPTQEEFSQFAQASPRRVARKKHADDSEDELDMLSSISPREKENVPASSTESTGSSKKSQTHTPSGSGSGAAKPHSINILLDKKRKKSSSDSFSIESLPLPPHVSSPLSTTNSKAQSTKNATGVSIVQNPKDNTNILDSASTTAATESKHKATGKRTRDSASAERERDKPISALLKGPVYRVGLSKRARVESLHSYLRRES